MSPVNSLWFKWKSLRLPWRRSFLVGTDLSGNTYWEFKDALNAGRLRRIVKHNPRTHHADLQVTPQWHQWLRYVRADPPSLEEQQQDVLRQIQLKELARLADERWASKPSVLDKPRTQQPAPALRTTDSTISQQTSERTSATQRHPSLKDSIASQADTKKSQKSTTTEESVKDPWATHKGGPGEKWQPEAWTPTASRR